MADQNEVNVLVDHLFRHEAGKMVSVLTRIFGFQNIEQAEDIVQDTLIKALEVWKLRGVPSNPAAWLYKTAKNRAIDELRKEKLHVKKQSAILPEEENFQPDQWFLEGQIRDNMLRMMFICCHPSLKYSHQITLILKTLCGLSITEIARAFLTSEDAIRKQIQRSRKKLQDAKVIMVLPGKKTLSSRLLAVLKTLYLLFNEGYNSGHPEKLIREDLCREALRLSLLLANEKITALPSVHALIALITFHSARLKARIGENGKIILLQDQNRSLWDTELIRLGNYYLALSAQGDSLHEFHLEAAIASCHANAPSYKETDWKSLYTLYTLLLLKSSSPMVALNRYVVISKLKGTEYALKRVLDLKALQGYPYYHAVLGDLFSTRGAHREAALSFKRAFELTSSGAEKKLIQEKLFALEKE